jgi:hypothetical protein
VQIFDIMGISFFNKPRYKRFDLPTRYYNEEKSDFERRMRKWETDNTENKNGFDKENFKEDLRRSYNSGRVSQSSFNQKYTSFRRLFYLMVILVVIIGMIYWLGNKFLV